MEFDVSQATPASRFPALATLALAVTTTARAERAAPWDRGPVGRLGRPAQQRRLQLQATQADCVPAPKLPPGSGLDRCGAVA